MQSPLELSALADCGLPGIRQIPYDADAGALKGVQVKAQRVSMLLVEQNAETALQLADRVYVIDHGTVVFDGTPAALRADTQVTATYLGVGG